MSTSSHSSETMSTLKRLSDDDVRGIFEALHQGKDPPKHLTFSIVPVGAKGLKLSPPSYQFEDGLYVLLRPYKKKKLMDKPEPPPHLKHLLLDNFPAATCPWSLSGPQFPAPTSIQQRYCYPRGDPEYSSRKGGALWTMMVNGVEDVEFRLLHVYLSPKRAANKGMDMVESSLAPSPPAPKRPRRRSLSSTPPSYCDSSTAPALSFDTAEASPPLLSRPPLPERFVSPHSTLPAPSPVRRPILHDEDDDDHLFAAPFDLEQEDPLLKLLHQNSMDEQVLEQSLEDVHAHLRSTIAQARVEDQPAMVGVLAGWARQVMEETQHGWNTV